MNEQISKKIVKYLVIVLLAILSSITYISKEGSQEMLNYLKIEALGEPSENGIGGTEVWIQKITIDDKEIPLERYENIDWDIKWDKLISMKGELNLNISTKRNIQLDLYKHISSGKVKITYNDKEEVYDLYSSEPDSLQLVYYPKIKTINMFNFNTIFAFCLYVILYSMFIILFRCKYINKIIIITISNIMIYSSLNFGQYYSISQLILLNAFYLVALAYIYKCLKDKINIYNGINNMLFYIYNFLCSFIICISFKVNVNKSCVTTIGEIYIFIAILIAMVVFLLIIESYIIVKSKNVPTYNSNSLIKKATILMALVSGGYIIAFYPGFMTSDSVDQWGQMLAGVYYDAHPIFHTLFNRICTLFWESPAAISIIQSIIFIFICIYGLKILMELEVPKKVIYIILAIYMLSPVYHLMNMTLWKDIIYSDMLLLYTLYLMQIIRTDFKWLNRKCNFILFVGINLGTLLFRHNGMSVVIATVIMSLVFYFKRWKNITMVYSIIMILFVLIIGPIYNLFGLQSIWTDKSSPEKIYKEFNYHNLAYIILNNGDIKESELEDISKIIEIDQLLQGYSKYHTLGYWGINDRVNEEYLRLNKEHYKRLYTEISYRNKELTLENTLNTKSYLWEAMQPEDGYLNLAPVNYIWENNYNIKLNPISIQLNKILTGYFEITQSKYLISFVWRPVIILLAIIFCAIILIYKKGINYLLILVPLMGNWAGLVLEVTFQDFRYMYATHLIFPIVLGLISIKKEQKELKG